MAFQIPTVKYSGKINEVPVGSQKVMLGGQSAYSFHTFEGEFPNKPKIALDVWDVDPGDDCAPALREAFAGVMGDPGAWAKKCVEYGADMVVLHLKSSDPNDQDTGPAEAVAAVEKVLAAVDVPVIVFGVDNKDKDVETLSAVAEKFAGKNLILGPVTDKNYKQIGAQALAYGHAVIARSPIDVNLAKQLNILLTGLGLTKDKIIVDPTTGGLGYGMEYGYSVMERIQMAALVQQDDNLQQPMISFFGEDIWKSKEANLPTDENPQLGEAACRGVLMEVTEAVAVLAAGVFILSMRHPASVKIVRQYIDLAYDGGEVKDADLPVVPVIPADKF
ncbi:acetyl-CoA decarbonylase/synthase complex subunit delta [Deltaproteobacteria bacterium OttesenSCG-928-M10]|nr:acetyl-CoA decarbonylase/synthase complex subunit delta [Deltaproteobacteria bacterium OttesenSCG-928-M10]